MDAFYASVEQRDNPALRGKPIAVGGSAKRGVVAAASYEARRFGVRSAMPGVTARRRCPQLLFVKPRFDVYREVSRQIHAIFARYSDLIEPLSLDEAYLDVTADKAGLGSATLTAQRIRGAIRDGAGTDRERRRELQQVPGQGGLGSEQARWLCMVRPEEGAAFVAALPARRFYRRRAADRGAHGEPGHPHRR
jgi:DNA polymerase-4